MSDPLAPSPSIADPLALDELLERGGVKACCAAVYEHPAVRWLLGGELHPGGEGLTRRALELLELGPGDRLLDVASGAGATAILAAAETRCEAVGIDYGAAAVAGAGDAARERGLSELVSFARADAEALPFGAAEFDAVICECSLCTFPDKVAALAEMRRVLRPGGRFVLTDVVVDADLLPLRLRGELAAVACIGEALPRAGYEQLLDEAGFERLAFEPADAEVAAMADRVLDRLRGARILGLGDLVALEGGLDEAIELARLARRAIEEGALGYAVFAARLPDARQHPAAA